MTARTLATPAGWSVVAIAVALLTELIPPPGNALARFWLLATLLIRDILVAKHAAAETARELADVKFALLLASTARSKEFAEASLRFADVARKMESDKTTARTDLEAQTTTLSAKIAEGTKASKEAQREANDVNQKIASLNKRLVDAIPPRAQIDDIQQTGEETHDIVLGALKDK